MIRLAPEWTLSVVIGSTALAVAMCSSGTGDEGKEEGSQAPDDLGVVHCVLTVGLAASGTEYQAKVTVENRSDDGLFLLRYNLPSDGSMTSSLFVVERGGVKVPYRGRAVKRRAPTQADYMELKRGSEHTVFISLGSAYDFSLPGQYAFRYETFNPKPGTHQIVKVVSNTVWIEVEP